MIQYSIAPALLTLPIKKFIGKAYRLYNRKFPLTPLLPGFSNMVKAITVSLIKRAIRLA